MTLIRYKVNVQLKGGLNLGAVLTGETPLADRVAVQRFAGYAQVSNLLSWHEIKLTD